MTIELSSPSDTLLNRHVSAWIVCAALAALNPSACAPERTTAAIAPTAPDIIGEVSDATGTWSLRGGISIQQRQDGVATEIAFVSPLRPSDSVSLGLGAPIADLGAWIAGTPLREIETLDQYAQVSYEASDGRHVFRQIRDARFARTADGGFTLDLVLGPAFIGGAVIDGLSPTATARVSGPLSVGCSTLGDVGAQTIPANGTNVEVSYTTVADPGFHTEFCRTALTRAGLADLIR